MHDTSLWRSVPLVAQNWKWMMVRGVLALALGKAALLFPAGALFAFTMLFAAFAGVDGIASLIAGIQGAAHKEDRWIALVLRGVIGLVAAGLFVALPLEFTVSYALATLVLVAAWAIAVGLLEIVAAVRLRKEIRGEVLLALSGTITVGLGVAILVLLYLQPIASILSVAWLIGAWALLGGGLLIILAWRLRASRQAPKDLGTEAVAA
ncbi:HdeD family acid-resistance protein [Novosphingobium sp. YAF33]|uniref:HdeD family acid-resistance protein n=1 Tax=Novosphingobium sp. YAF33 TaxID=3233082 RepID=UPI003F9B9B0D